MNKKPFIVTGLALLAAFFILTSNSVDAAFCDGDFLTENITVNDVNIKVGSTLCTQGCIDSALLTFGEPGCQENEVIKWIMIAGIAVLMTLVIRWVFS